jgi:hypothetical protein
MRMSVGIGGSGYANIQAYVRPPAAGGRAAGGLKGSMLGRIDEAKTSCGSCSGVK